MPRLPLIIIIIVLLLIILACLVVYYFSTVVPAQNSQTAALEPSPLLSTSVKSATPQPTATVTPTPTPTPTPDDGRTTVAEGFYYKPLNEEMKAYITGSSFPSEPQDDITYDDLHYVSVLHYTFDGEICTGELIVAADLADEVTRIFYRLYLAKYPMTSIILIDEFGGSTGDDASMSANNTSAFNYRLVAGTDHLSKHALGRAIDINPMMNPYVQNDHFSPENGAAYVDRSDIQLGMIDENDLCYQLFIEYGWEWGGAWHSSKDYQHFQKD